MSVRISHVVTCNEGIHLVSVFFEHHGALMHIESSPLCSFLPPRGPSYLAGYILIFYIDGSC